MARSFYIGDQVKDEDVHASFEDGVLKVEIPAQEEAKRAIPEKKAIKIA